MTAAASPVTQGAGSSAAGAFTSVLNAALGTVAAKLERRIAGWTEKLNGIAAGGGSSEGLVGLADDALDDLTQGAGVAQRAGAEGVKAGLHGGNPIWAAITGAWQSGSPAVKAAIVAASLSAILLLLVSPVLLLVYFLSLLIIAAVQRLRASKR